METVDAGSVLGILFSAAAVGGAYDRGCGAALGRRRAWQSMAGLVGVDPDLPLSTIRQALDGCLFYSFLSPPGWFAHVAWDVGIVVLLRDRRTAVVLAATDTD